MLRVLHIFYNMGNGGVESFVMNYYRHIDRTLIQFDFLTSVEESGYYDDEIRSLGGKVFHAYPLLKNPIKTYQSIAKIVSDNGYSIVHRHTGSAFGYFDLRGARAGGAKTLILHSHASSPGNRLLHAVSQRLLGMDCTRFACSKEAGEFMFGKKQPFEIIPNAIDVEKYAFSPQIRKAVRAENRVGERIVIGHVGAFFPVKNHEFLLDIFRCLHRDNDAYVLWLVGDGELKSQVEEKVRAMGLEDAVCFWGNRDDVPELLQAMDLFVLPSLHEGFNIAALEAQCAGLPCFISSRCAGLRNAIFLPLESGPTFWAEQISKVTLPADRSEGADLIRQAGYDIAVAAPELAKRYLSYAR